MPDMLTQHNIAALGVFARLSDHSTAVAAGTGDATLVTGNTIDRMALGGSLAHSALMGVIYETTLAAAATLSIGFDVQDSPDGTNWTDYLVVAPAVIATGPGGGGTLKGQSSFSVDLNNARRYVRCNYTPDLSAASLDTFYGDAIGFFAGFDRLPPSGS